MKQRQLRLLGILSVGLLILMAGSQVVIAQGPPGDAGPPGKMGDGNFTIDTGTVTIKVVGGQNVPFFTFWASDNSSDTYRVQFDQVFEAYDNNTNGAFDNDTDSRVAGPPYPLASLNWDFSNVTESDDGAAHFNITSSNGLFQFRNHIGDNASSFKFDVVIDGYSFKSNDSLLVLSFKLQNLNGTSTSSQDGNRVSFDDAFFEVEDTAQDDNGDIDVGLSASGSKAYMSYSQFEGKLVHDPTVGIQASGLNDGTDGSDGTDGTQDSESGQIVEVQDIWPQRIPKVSLLLSTVVASIIAIATPLAIYRRRSQ